MSSDLTAHEIIEIDRQIVKNRETVCFFVRNLASNAKDKTRKGIVVIILGGAVYSNNVQPSEAIGLSMPPATYKSNVQIAKVITRKNILLFISNLNK